MNSNELALPNLKFGELYSVLLQVRAYRDDGDYVAVARTFPLESGHQHADNLAGNLGALLFSDSSGRMLGRNWIAPSRQLRSEVRDKAFARGHRLLHYCKDGTIAALEAGKKEARIPLSFSPGEGHANDSECALLNTLTWELRRSNIREGTLRLLTERIPCQSCTAIIVKFAEEFPGVSINIAYLMDYVNERSRRSHCGFLEDLANGEANVSLFRYEELSETAGKVTHIPPGTPLLGYSAKYIYPGARRFAGIRNGKAVMTTYTEDDAHELRTMLLIKPGPDAGEK